MLLARRGALASLELRIDQFELEDESFLGEIVRQGFERRRGIQGGQARPTEGFVALVTSMSERNMRPS